MGDSPAAGLSALLRNNAQSQNVSEGYTV